MGFVSYDVASIYLGASGIKFGDFILESMCGTSLNIFIDGLFGKYLFNPLGWQLWAVESFLRYLEKFVDWCYDGIK